MKQLLILSILVMISSSVWAKEDCSRTCTDGELAFNENSCSQCRIANALEDIATALLKPEALKHGE